ncbi:MAG: hypothetical protein KDE27_12130 [Planctomycetes bacterium]|nr:hypothetical protein [Planctomycetota bacterium]
MKPRGKKARATSRDAPLRISSLRVEDLAQLLEQAGVAAAPRTVAADLEAGAPTNPDGTVNLVHYAAWCVRELGRSGGR